MLQNNILEAACLVTPFRISLCYVINICWCIYRKQVKKRLKTWLKHHCFLPLASKEWFHPRRAGGFQQNKKPAIKGA